MHVIYILTFYCYFKRNNSAKLLIFNAFQICEISWKVILLYYFTGVVEYRIINILNFLSDGLNVKKAVS